MNIKAIIIAVLATVLFAAGGYWLYQRYFQSTDYPLRALVPSDAVLLYSSTQPEAAWEDLKQHTFGELLKDMPGMQRFDVYEQELKRLLPSYEALKNREFLFSLHITERNNFDYLLLMPLQGEKDQRLLRQLRKEIEDSPANYRLDERLYQGVKLYEIRDLNGGRTFSFFAQEGVLVGSFTSFLVEGAIRQKAASSTALVPAWMQQTSGTSMETLGTLAINLQQLPALLRVFSHDDSLVQELLPRLPYYSQLEAATAENGLLLTGFVKPDNPQEADFLWALHGQKPQPMRLSFLVPLRAASLVFVGLSNSQEWHQRLRTYWERKAPEQWERWQVLEAKAPDARQLAAIIGNEAGLATLPTAGAGRPERLLMLHLSDSSNAAGLLREMSARVALQDTLYSEVFLRQQLQELPYDEFPASLLGSAYLGFGGSSYYTIVEDYLVISSSIPALKEMLLDIEAEETWQRSVRLNNFMSRLDAEQNYALYLNTATLWPMLYRRLAGPWKMFWDKHNQALRQIDLLSLQLSSAEGAFYTNLFLHLDRRPERQLEQIQLVRKAGSRLESPVVHAPVAVSYRQQRSGHWLVQDSARALYLLNNAGETVRSTRMGGYWQSQLAELDPQKNNSPHYFITTPDSAYLFQPNLQLLKPFPLSLPNTEKIDWASVIDYDGTRRYRFLLASGTGNIFMYDLDGINLEGWQPVALKGSLSAAPGHLRVRSRDIIYAFQKKGEVHAFTRRGEYLKGFPFALGDSLLGPVHIRQGSDFKSTRFITVTASGLFWEWDLEGRIISRKQLYRPDARARFYMVPDARGKRFLIAQQDRFRLRLMDENGNDLFEKDYLGASKLEVQYFPFSEAAALVAVTDTDQEFTYLYDLGGNLLQTQPLNSCCPIGLQMGSAGDSLRLVKAYSNAVEQHMLPVINSSK
ncbi:hypothetical protein D770_08835 [Flammeovirgaceae bacterium 311]|nr:hypothetical protein D770_08835 [Flammeovirgaceae bacterium 311]